MRNGVDFSSIIIPLAIALTAEKKYDRLLERILTGAKEICNADGGTIYILSGNQLRFEIVLNETLGLSRKRTDEGGIIFPPIDMYQEKTGIPNHSNIASFVALTGNTKNIPDAYHAAEFDFSGTMRFDRIYGYRSVSFLTIPLKNNNKKVIGVLQLINSKDPESGEIVPFASSIEEKIESLASLAAVSIENQNLVQSQRDLFDSFTRIISYAIDEKSPFTAGHCRRVPVITDMILDAIHNATEGPFVGTRFTDDERYEIRTAAWLHDIGKITTPEHVVDKATKLYDRLTAIETRIEVLKRDAEIRHLRAVEKCPQDREFLRLQYETELAEMEDSRRFIQKINLGDEPMTQEKVARLKRIASLKWRGLDGEIGDFLSPEEVQNLCIEHGTLTAEERKIINDHIVVTIDMLKQLPFPKHLQRVPEYAGGHHERLDGSGYPKGLRRDQLALPTRIIAIADIFEALTASDRPYKKGLSLRATIEIMASMRDRLHIDPDVFRLFLSSGIHLRYAKKYLRPEQIDEVDLGRYL